MPQNPQQRRYGIEEKELRDKVAMLERQMRERDALMAVGCVWRAENDLSGSMPVRKARNGSMKNLPCIYTFPF